MAENASEDQATEHPAADAAPSAAAAGRAHRLRKYGVAVVIVGIFAAGLAVGRSTNTSSLDARGPIAETDQAKRAERLAFDDVDDGGVPTSTSGTVPSPTGTSTPTRPTPSDPRPPDPEPGGFIEIFDGNSGLASFNAGLWQRDDIVVSTRQWHADHDLDCGSPDTQRTIHRDTDEWRYMCRDHMMTAIGDTSGYSIGWFSPKMTFNGQTRIRFDVNTTDLKQRQWWEVSVVSSSFDSGIPGCRQCMTNHSAAFPEPNFDSDQALVLSAHPGGGSINVNYEQVTGATLCDGLALDPEGCSSKMLRRTWTLTDNQDGTVTVTFLDNTYTMPGSFPDGDFNVVFKDHNYTPDKDGRPDGYTWHWDNIVVGT